MAHQFEQQRDAARRILYVQGGWLCSLLFEITAPLGDATLSPRFSALELRICPTSLLQATQRAALPTIFEDAITGIASQHLNLLQILRRVADDGSRSFRGWLWFFSLPQCDFIESIGPVPWDNVVNPLWDQIIAAVEASWTAFKFYLRFRTPHLALPVSRLNS